MEAPLKILNCIAARTMFALTSEVVISWILIAITLLLLVAVFSLYEAVNKLKRAVENIFAMSTRGTSSSSLVASSAPPPFPKMGQSDWKLSRLRKAELISLLREQGIKQESL